MASSTSSETPTLPPDTSWRVSPEMAWWSARKHGVCMVCGEDLDFGCRCDDREIDRGIETVRDPEREP